MLLRQLKIQRVRCIDTADITFHSKLNLILGSNGAGKTSILEAINILSAGRSFRSRKVDKIIQSDSDYLTVFGIVSQDRDYQIGVRRNKKGGFSVRIDKQNCSTLAELSRRAPVFVITPSYYDEMLAKRMTRLKLLDWGLFHVEHSFLGHWSAYNKLIKQRNALIKQIKRGRNSESELDYWDQLLVRTGEQLHRQRQNYCEQLKDKFMSVSENYSRFSGSAEIKYAKGWVGNSFGEQLKQSRHQDIRQGFTGLGPHKADLILSIDGELAVDVASRGQQKVLVNLLMLSIINDFVERTQKKCLVAIDDLPSELDEGHQMQLLDSLMSLDGAQIVVTAISLDSLPEPISGYNKKMFHVEHGQIQVQ